MDISVTTIPGLASLLIVVSHSTEQYHDMPKGRKQIPLLWKRNMEKQKFRSTYRLSTEEFFFTSQSILDTEVRVDILHYQKDKGQVKQKTFANQRNAGILLLKQDLGRDCSSDLTKYTEFSGNLMKLLLLCATSAAKRQECNKQSPECYDYISYEPLER